MRERESIVRHTGSSTCVLLILAKYIKILYFVGRRKRGRLDVEKYFLYELDACTSSQGWCGLCTWLVFFNVPSLLLLVYDLHLFFSKISFIFFNAGCMFETQRCHKQVHTSHGADLFFGQIELLGRFLPFRFGSTVQYNTIQYSTFLGDVTLLLCVMTMLCWIHIATPY